MSRRSSRSRAGRTLSRVWWSLVAMFVVLMGAHLWETEGAGSVVVAVICAALVVTFSRSRRRSRH